MKLLQKAASWLGMTASRHDGDNFRTNRVTLAEYTDSMASATGSISLPATFACLNLLAGTISSLPLMVYRTVGGAREVARDHPLYRLLHDSPNFDQTAVDFIEGMVLSIELYGNAYAEKKMTMSGERLLSLEPIKADSMRVTQAKDGTLEYRWSDRGVQTIADQSKVLHIRGFGGEALGGTSALVACGRAFAAALSVENAASSMFRNGIRTTGAFSAEAAKPLTADQMQQAQQVIEEKYLGAVNAGRPMLLNGLKWQSISMNADDAQLLESRKFAIEEVARAFGVPPHMIGHTENSTSWGTGLEQQTLGFVTFSLRRRLKRIEQALAKQLLTEIERQAGFVIEFNLEGLLRGDSASRAAFYASGLLNGWRTINEVRAMENLPPVPGGDVPRMQSQNVPIDAPVGAGVAGDAA